MKNLKIKYWSFGVLALVGLISIQNASAALTTNTWSSPLSLNSPNLVGVAMGVTGDGNGDWSYESAVAQELLNLGANQINVSKTIYFLKGSQLDSDVTTFSTSPTDYSGEVISTGTSSGSSVSVGSGYDYVLAKYDGQSAGYILFYLGGNAAIIPQYPYNFWTTNSTQYALSGWTAFNTTTAVPEPSTIVAGALLLLPLGFSAVRILRKQRTV